MGLLKTKECRFAMVSPVPQEASASWKGILLSNRPVILCSAVL